MNFLFQRLEEFIFPNPKKYYCQVIDVALLTDTETHSKRDIYMTAGHNVHFQSTDWCTPPRYIEAVKHVFGGTIELDPCSNQWSTVKAKAELSLPENDVLHKNWNYLGSNSKVATFLGLDL